MSEPILKTHEVVKIYRVNAGAFRGKRVLKAVNGVSIKLEKGGVLGLVGESGCGKSTMARIILGLEPPTSGEVWLDSHSVFDISRREVARRIQPIFQDPYSSLNPRKSVGSIISLPLRVHKIGNSAEWNRKVEGIMDVVGLPRQLKRNFPNQLSGGQRQRVAIARALIMQPDIVICDEPTSALDVSVQAQILNLLIDLRNEFGLTYILISHDLAVVEHLASRVAVMYLGRIVEEAATKEIFQKPRHPYTQALLTSVLTPEPRLGLPETHLGVSYPNPLDPPPGCTFHPRCPKATQRCKTVTPEPVIESGRLVECFFPESI
ncbi:MAG: ATP-binding cassette domain-containing protein [Deltaproteobacteria bacterium]|nr:ATP-binding cassette domain-containing protein [Deltaproteobacteria bacterium]